MQEINLWLIFHSHIIMKLIDYIHGCMYFGYGQLCVYGFVSPFF